MMASGIPSSPNLATPASVAIPPGEMPGETYEQLLSSNPRWALTDASLFFEGKGRVHETLNNLVPRLEALGVSYSVVGGLALFRHGYRRFTEDVDLLVTEASLAIIHDHLDGVGYVRTFSGGKNMRDVQTKVKIDFLVTGKFPGDGKPKPIAYPDPANVSIQFDGIRYATLATLLELKLASGMSGAGRLKDLADVQELIRAANLSLEQRESLHPFVRDKYTELWNDLFGRATE